MTVTNTPKGIFFKPYSDFGFKKLFGEEASKDLLIDFLNQFLPEHHQVATITFLNIENIPDSTEGRRAFFDIACKSEEGVEFIVEMQKGKMQYFRESITVTKFKEFGKCCVGKSDCRYRLWKSA